MLDDELGMSDSKGISAIPQMSDKRVIFHATV
jgi:hypothetical protein